MSIKDRIVELIYKLEDKFTGKHKQVVSSISAIDKAADKSAKGVERSTGRIRKSFDAIAAGGKKLVVGMRNVATAVIAAGAAVFGAAKRTANSIDEIGKSSEKLGISTEALSKLQYAAEIAAVPFKQLETGLQRMVRRLSEVANTGKGTAQSALKRLGLDAQELINLPVEEQLGAIIGELEKLENQSEKIELAQKLFDSEGVNLVRLTTASIKEYGDELERIGGVISQAEADEAAQFNDNISKLSASISALGRNAAGGVIEFLNDLFAYFKQDSGAAKTAADIDKISASAQVMGQTLNVVGQGIRAGWNVVTATFKTVATVITGSLAVIAKGLSKVTFGDLSDDLEKTAERMKQASEEMSRGVVEDINDVGDAVVNMGKAAVGADRNTQSPLKEVADKAEEDADRMSRLQADIYKTFNEPVAKSGLADSADMASEAISRTADQVKNLQIVAESGSIDIDVGKVDISAALQQAQEALNANPLKAKVNAFVDTNELRQQMQKSVDEAFRRAANKAGGKR